MRAMGHGSSAADSAAGTADPAMLPGAAKAPLQREVQRMPMDMYDQEPGSRLANPAELEKVEAAMAAGGGGPGAGGLPQAIMVRRGALGASPEAQEEKLDARSRRMPPNAPKQAKQQQPQASPKASVDEEFVNRVVSEAVREVYESVKVETSTWQTSIMHLTDAVAKLTKRLEVFEVKVEDMSRLDNNYAKVATRVMVLEEKALRADCQSPKAAAGAGGPGTEGIGNTVEQLGQLTDLVKVLEENVSSLRQGMGKMRSELQESVEERSELRRHVDSLRSQAGGLESRIAEATRSLAGAAAAAAAEAGAAAEAAAAAAASTQVDASGHNSNVDGGSITTAPPSTVYESTTLTEVAQHVAQLRQELHAERAERTIAMQATVDRVEAMRNNFHDVWSGSGGTVPSAVGGYPVSSPDLSTNVKRMMSATRGAQAATLSPTQPSSIAVPVVHATPAVSGGIMTPGKGGERSKSLQRAASPTLASVVATAAEPSSRHVSSPLRVRPPRAASPVLETTGASMQVRSMSPVMPPREGTPLNTGSSVRTLASARDVVRSPTMPASLTVSWKNARAAGSGSVGGWVSPVGTPPAPAPVGLGARATSPTGLRVPPSFSGAVTYAAPTSQPGERLQHPPKVKAPPPLLTSSMAQPVSMRATLPARMQHMSLMSMEALAVVAQQQLAAQPQ